MFAAVGCTELPEAVGLSESAASSARVVSGTDGSRIDAGVVVADRGGYFCLPLERVGLDSQAAIASLTSSCECVRPRVVTYKSGNESWGRGILLEYVAEPTPAQSDREYLPANLGVIIEATLADGGKHTFTVDLLHTVLAEEGRR